MSVIMIMVMMMIMIMVVVMVAIMIMVMMVVVFRDFLLAVDADGEMGRGDAAAGDGTAFVGDAGDARGIEAGESGVGVGMEFEEGGGQHVAGSTGGAVDMETFHVFLPAWLMRWARTPAPKPLSMLTTATPAAHELSMARRAERPPTPTALSWTAGTV